MEVGRGCVEACWVLGRCKLEHHAVLVMLAGETEHSFMSRGQKAKAVPLKYY